MFPFGCDGYVTAVVVDQMQRLYNVLVLGCLSGTAVLPRLSLDSKVQVIKYKKEKGVETLVLYCTVLYGCW